MENKKSPGKKTCTNREYPVQHKKYVDHQDVNIYYAKKHYPELKFLGPHKKSHVLRGLGKHYHMCFDPNICHRTCAICHIPCACPPRTSILDQPWDPVMAEQHNTLKTGFFTTQNNPTNLNLQLQLNLYPPRPISGCYRCHPTPTHPYFWCLMPLRQYMCFWCWYTVPVPFHNALCLSVMPAAALCQYFLIRPTLKYMSPLRATRADLLLSVLLPPDLCCYVPLCNTKICPDNTEE